MILKILLYKLEIENKLQILLKIICQKFRTNMFFLFLKINLFIYLFIFGCVGSLLLHAGSL